MAGHKEPDLHGLLIVNKPRFITSHDVVSRIRRMTGIRRVGHAGTLDPFATGVVVVAVGRATRVLQHVQDTDKRYLAHIVLGAETDTADVDGVVIERAQPKGWPAREDVERALRRFTGTFEQIPPVYSAIKVEGKRLYREAREGRAITAPARSVTIHSLELLHYDPPDVVVDIHCAKGTYIRSVARDLGAALGVHGYCHALMRTATGPFCLAQSWTLDELDELDPREHWHQIALHPDAGLTSMPAVVLSGAQAKAWYHGQSFDVPVHADGGDRMVRMYASSGDFLGVGALSEHGSLKSQFVFTMPSEDGIN